MLANHLPFVPLAAGGTFGCFQSNNVLLKVEQQLSIFLSDEVNYFDIILTFNTE